MTPHVFFCVVYLKHVLYDLVTKHGPVPYLHKLDGFFSLFGSQYKVLLDVLGDLFDVILFAVCLPRSDELWVYDQDYL